MSYDEIGILLSGYLSRSAKHGGTDAMAAKLAINKFEVFMSCVFLMAD